MTDQELIARAAAWNGDHDVMPTNEMRATIAALARELEAFKRAIADDFAILRRLIPQAAAEVAPSDSRPVETRSPGRGGGAARGPIPVSSERTEDEDERERLIEVARAGYELSTWAACIKWKAGDNTEEWLEDLEAKIHRVQNLWLAHENQAARLSTSRSPQQEKDGERVEHVQQALAVAQFYMRYEDGACKDCGARDSDHSSTCCMMVLRRAALLIHGTAKEPERTELPVLDEATRARLEATATQVREELRPLTDPLKNRRPPDRNLIVGSSAQPTSRPEEQEDEGLLLEHRLFGLAARMRPRLVDGGPIDRSVLREVHDALVDVGKFVAASAGRTS